MASGWRRGSNAARVFTSRSPVTGPCGNYTDGGMAAHTLVYVLEMSSPFAPTRAPTSTMAGPCAKVGRGHDAIQPGIP